ncbi:MAG: amino acid adenylation domain-containing protein, partial [bacterium]|nr:amino acid adenylation domain-containing protein [bacterium]
MTKLDRKKVEDMVALTPLQEGMLFHYLKNPDSDIYFEQLILEITGTLDIDCFERAWGDVIEVNEMLRSLFRWEKMDEPMQVRLKNHRFRPVYLDLSKEEGTRRESMLEEIKEKDKKQKFNLQQVPFRVTLCRFEDRKHFMIISNHHILYDGWSNGIILREFFRNYNNYNNGTREKPSQKTKFKDFVKWVRTPDKDRQEKYWTRYLEGVDGGTEISVKKSKPGETPGTGIYTFNFPSRLYEKLHAFAKERKLTAAACLYGAWACLLQKYNNSGDIIFGTTVSGRSAPIDNIENMVGLFINTLPLRIKTSHLTALELITRINNTLKERKEFEGTSLADIKKWANLSGEEELFDSVMVVENYPLDTRSMQENGGLSAVSYAMAEITHYDLNAGIMTGNNPEITFGYNSHRFEEPRIQALSRHFITIVEGFLGKPGEEYGRIELLSGEEKKRILDDFNDPGSPFKEEKTITGLFAEQVEKNPDSIALESRGGQLSYNRLHEESLRFAGVLRGRGVRTGGIVAIMVERSLEMVVGIMGILKSGAAYLPIEPGHPEERIDFMLRDSGARILLKSLRDQTNPNDRHTSDLSPSGPACIIYSYGTTGRPKGVIVEHRSIVKQMQGGQEAYPSSANDSYLLKTTYIFDVSISELFGWFLGGGRLAILEAGAEKDPMKIMECIAAFSVTHINFVPSVFNAFVDVLEEGHGDSISRLRYILLGGEIVPPELVTRFRRLGTRIRLENLYGPTEATIYTSRYSLSDWDGTGSIPIGKPVRGASIFILDIHDRMQPVGIWGEVCVGGVFLTRGYLNRPELTAEKFDKDFKKDKKEPSAAIYRTGDIARWMPDGNIQFRGRMDHQLKVRGFRIETAEIESRLLTHDEIKKAVVIGWKDGNNDTALCAYIVTEKELTAPELREYLAITLPGYMIPSYFTRLDEIPLNPSGKVDRRALPEPGIASGAEYHAPDDEIQHQLVDIWSPLLGMDRSLIGIDDDFFELGGHSLKVTGLTGRIHKAFNVKVPFDQIFQSPTVRGLSQYIRDAMKEEYLPLEIAKQKEFYPLSSLQERLNVIYQVAPDSTAYNMPAVMDLEGRLDTRGLEEVFGKLIRRHESLRTSFQVLDNVRVQRIHEEVKFEIEPFNPERISDFVRPFDLSRAPMLRVGLHKQRENHHVMVVDMHHIITDGTSVGILIRDFMALLAGDPLPPTTARYRDFTLWQNSLRGSSTLKAQEDYWMGIFSDEPPVLHLPCDSPRPAVPGFDGKTIWFEAGEKSAGALNRLVKKQGVTLFMALMAVYNVFLSKISGQEDILVGLPTAGRVHPEFEAVIGMFVNTLVLRNSPRGDRTFSQFLRQLKERTLGAFENQDYPFEDMVENVNTVGDPGRNPLFDTMLVLENTDIPEIRIPGLKLKDRAFTTGTSKFDLTLYCKEKSGGLVFSIEYRTSLFREETIQRFSRYFLKLLEEIPLNPHQLVSELEIISPEEKRQILVEFNDTDYTYPSDRIVHLAFEDQVERTPREVALVSTMGVNVSLTYSRLNHSANRLARLMRERGVGQGDVTGIMMERSANMVIAMLATLKAGSTYVPIDQEYPGNRILTMMAESKASLLLTTLGAMERQSQLTGISGNILTMDGPSELEQLALQPVDNPEPVSGGEDLIYIIFTSGSTGKPKGAGVYHRGYHNLINWFVTDFEITRRDRELLLTSLSFDLTQKSVYAPLISGGQLYLPSVNYFDPAIIVKDIAAGQVTWTNCTPSMFYRLVETSMSDGYRPLSSLRKTILGGEPIALPMLADWLRSPQCHSIILNTYGPTEATDVCAKYKLTDPERFITGNVPTGSPVFNVQLYVVNNYLKLQPVGIPGELLIGGAGVGRGYVNAPDLTKEKFIRHSFVEGEPPVPLYFIGDLVKWTPDGNLEYLGRVDHQVKIRGFRIELGEVEGRLSAHPQVKETVVIARKRDEGDYFLCAYVVPVPEAADLLEPSILKEHLASDLPGYMVPTYIVPLEAMPLNPNGKVDRKALPDPGFNPEQDYAQPSTHTEKKLAQIWSGLLGIPPQKIDIDTDFFDMGGQSLKATTMVSQIHKEFDVMISLVDIFETSTIRGIGRLIGGSSQTQFVSIVPVADSEYYDLSSAQKRIFLLDRMQAGSTWYNIPLIMRLEGNLDRSRLENTFKQLIHRHESLRTSFHTIDNRHLQKIHGDVDFQPEYFNPDSGNPDSEHSIIQGFVRPFDLEQAPLLRTGLIETGKHRFILMVDMHHIVCDAVSMEILVNDFKALYSGASLAPLNIRYRDYCHWQNSQEQRAGLEPQEQWWLEQFPDELPVLDLPIDFSRPPVQGFDGDTVHFSITGDEIARIRELAVNQGVTTYMVLLALYNVFLTKITAQEDLIVGTPVAGRRHSDMDHIIGVFINTLALRNNTGGHKSFTSLLDEVGTGLVNASENQDYPFEDLVEKVAVNRDTSRNPLFDTMFSLQDLHASQLQITGLSMTPYDYKTGVSKFDLLLIVVDTAQDLGFSFEYCTTLFEAQTMQRFIEFFKAVVAAVLADSSIKIKDIDVLSPGERERLLYEFNDTDYTYPSDRIVHHAFEDQVERTPLDVALISTMGDNVSLTYNQLNHSANRLARLMRTRGVGRGNVTGIMMERSANMVIALLATLKAGSTYVPIDREYPKNRILSMMEESKASLLLTTLNAMERQSQLEGMSENILTVDEPACLEQLEQQSPGNPGPAAGREDLIYIIFTSGSTGKPKGAGVYHRGYHNLINWFVTDYEITAKDRELLLTSLSFDLTQKSVYAPLITGGQL